MFRRRDPVRLLNLYMTGFDGGNVLSVVVFALLCVGQLRTWQRLRSAATSPRDIHGVPVMTSIVLVDDHRVVTRSLKAYLESFPDLKVTGIASSGEELFEHVDQWMPDVILQDLLLPGGIDGIETTRRVLARRPRCQGHRAHGLGG